MEFRRSVDFDNHFDNFHDNLSPTINIPIAITPMSCFPAELGIPIFFKVLLLVFFNGQ